MAEGVRVSAEDYKQLQQAIKALDDKKLKRILRRRLREAAGPIGRLVLEHGVSKMPQRGGLAAYLARQGGVNVSMRQTGADLWLGPRRKTQLSAMNRGHFRHPVWGTDVVKSHRYWPWVNQDVPEGAFTEALEHLPEEQMRSLNKTMDDIIKELKLS